jgi:hypothetical protein
MKFAALFPAFADAGLRSPTGDGVGVAGVFCAVAVVFGLTGATAVPASGVAGVLSPAGFVVAVVVESDVVSPVEGSLESAACHVTPGEGVWTAEVWTAGGGFTGGEGASGAMLASSRVAKGWASSVSCAGGVVDCGHCKEVTESAALTSDAELCTANPCSRDDAVVGLQPAGQRLCENKSS